MLPSAAEYLDPVYLIYSMRPIQYRKVRTVAIPEIAQSELAVIGSLTLLGVKIKSNPVFLLKPPPIKENLQQLPDWIFEAAGYFEIHPEEFGALKPRRRRSEQQSYIAWPECTVFGPNMMCQAAQHSQQHWYTRNADSWLRSTSPIGVSA